MRQVRIDPFWIDAHPVTNEEFARFIKATGYQTDAERFGWSFVFAGFLPDDFPPTRAVAQTPWWRQVHGADWRHPEGPHSDIAGRMQHPALHVSWTLRFAVERSSHPCPNTPIVLYGYRAVNAASRVTRSSTVPGYRASA